MIELDGSFGEGGGQILRTALALSVITGQAFHIVNIRANRAKPGLRRQHLAGVRAAAEIAGAGVEGAELSSRELTFRPGPVRPGNHRFAIGTGGSASLLCQAVLPALMVADAPSHVVFEGGTHNSGAPPFDYIERVFLPIVNRMGPCITANLVRHGFAQGGGGSFTVDIQPAKKLVAVQLNHRGPARSCSVRALLSNLPAHIGDREVAVIRSHWPDVHAEVRQVDAEGPGNIVLIEISCDHVTEIFTGFGERGVPAEKVAREAWLRVDLYWNAGVPVSEHLADQLLLPMALGEGGEFVTLPPTLHFTTNVDVIRKFLPVDVTTREIRPDRWQARVTT